MTMERLTMRIADTVGMALGHEEMHTMDEWVDMLQTRLCEYEDTGLTPEQITTLASDKLEQVTNMLVDTVPQLVAAIIERMPQLVEAAANNVVEELQEV